MMDQDLYSLFSLADRLGRTLQEVLAMSTTEISYWIAYLQLSQNRGAAQ